MAQREAHEQNGESGGKKCSVATDPQCTEPRVAKRPGRITHVVGPDATYRSMVASVADDSGRPGHIFALYDRSGIYAAMVLGQRVPLSHPAVFTVFKPVLRAWIDAFWCTPGQLSGSHSARDNAVCRHTRIPRNVLLLPQSNVPIVPFIAGGMCSSGAGTVLSR